MPDQIECPQCGAPFDHRPTNFKMPEPKVWVWEPTCTCFEDIVTAQIRTMFEEEGWRYGT